MTKIVCISDTHSRHRQITVPDGDILVHAGGLTAFGTLEQLQDVAEWMNGLPHKEKIVIAGDNDFIFEDEPKKATAILKKFVYLEGEDYTFKGIKFWGGPWSLGFRSWAFSVVSSELLEEKWKAIPEGVDVLLTHTPPHSILDGPSHSRTGCEKLLERVRQIKPKVHVFGHVHDGHGTRKCQGTRYVNASICSPSYRAINHPIVVDL